MYAVATDMNLAYTPAISETGIRELRDGEIDEVNGAFLANLAGGLVGGIAGGITGFVTSGGSFREAAIGGTAGAVVGLANPVRGVVGAANAVRLLHTANLGAVAGTGTGLAITKFSNGARTSVGGGKEAQQPT